MPPTQKLSRLDEAQSRGHMIGVYAPGMNPWKYPAGTAMKIDGIVTNPVDPARVRAIVEAAR